MQVDPFGTERMIPNSYTYAVNNPMAFVDPMGLLEWKTWLAVGAGVLVSGAVIVGTGGIALVGGALVVTMPTAGTVATALGGGMLAGAVAHKAAGGGVISGGFKGLAGAALPVLATAGAVVCIAPTFAEPTIRYSAAAQEAFEAGNRLLAEHFARLAGYNSYFHMMEFKEQIGNAMRATGKW